MSTTLRIRSAGRHIDIQCAVPEVANALAAIWEPALRLRQQVADEDAHRNLVVLDEGARLWLDGELIGHDDRLFQRHLQIEGLMIGRLLRTRSNVLHLHGGCVTTGSRNFLFLGESGAGKSTFTKMTLRRGGSLLSDDTLIVEGSRVYGVPRTIQFDAIASSEPIPPHLEDCDVTSYTVRKHKDGAPSQGVPLWRAAYPVEDSLLLNEKPWVVVELARGPEDAVRPLSDIERLSALHGATITTGKAYEGQFGWGPSFSVTWNDPAKAFALLTQLV